MKAIRRIPLLPLFICLVGLAFCLWVFLSGGKELCLTNGCSLFQDFSLAGVSLWCAGSVLFALLAALCLLAFVRMAAFIAGAALAADILLMAVMAVTSPCVNCLLVGLLIALTFIALMRSSAPGQRACCSPLLVVWGLFFVIAAGGVLREVPELWSPLPHKEQPSVQVFFSPSCRACQELTVQADRMADAAWFPVAEDSRDIWLIHAMSRHLEQGVPLREAVEKAQADLPGLADAPDLMALPEYRFGLLKPGMLLLQFRLWKNRAHVLSAGSDRLPFVEFRGLPSFLRSEPTPHVPGHGLSDGASALPAIPGVTDLTVDAFCGGEKAPGSCEENAPSPSPDEGSRGLIDTSGMFRQ